MSVPPALTPAPPRRGAVLRQIYLGFLLVLLSGALQRPLGGGTLQGSMGGVIVQGGNPAFKLLMIGALGTTAFLTLAGLPRLRLPQGSGFALGFTLLALASTLWSPLPQTTLQDAAGLAFSALVAIFAISFSSWPELRRTLVLVMTGLVAITGLLALFAPGYAFHGTQEFYYMHAGLLKGSYTHKNSLGAALTLALVVIACLGRETLGRALWVAAIALALGLIVLTGSAKSFVTVPAALLIGWQLVRVRSVLHLSLGAAYLSLLAGVALAFGGFAPLATVLAEGLGRDVTLSGRTLIWQTAIDYTLRSGHWLAGGGFGAAWEAGLGEYSQQQISFNAGHPHNGFIAIFADLGGLGLALALAAATKILLAGVRTADALAERRFVLVALVMILVTNTAGTTLPVPVSMTWFLFVILPALPAWSQRNA